MIKIVVCTVLILFISFNTYAQEENHIKTTAVKVTATKVEKELLEVPSSVSIVTEEDIKNLQLEQLVNFCRMCRVCRFQILEVRV